MSVIDQIMSAAGDMPDPGAHRRYLEKLSDEQLTDRLKSLQTTRGRKATAHPEIRFWTRAVHLAESVPDNQTELFYDDLTRSGGRARDEQVAG